MSKDDFFDMMKDIENFVKKTAPKYEQNVLDYYNCECKRIEKIAKEYEQNALNTFNEIESQVVNYQYGYGGEVLHRGYYCPSKIIDIVVGNGNRGIVSNNYSQIKSPEYIYTFDKSNKYIAVNFAQLKSSEFIYGFDTNNKLITVTRSFNKEFIIHKYNKEIGITIDNEFNDIQQICECQYVGGKIKSYVLGMYSQYDINKPNKKVIELTIENYEYLDNQLIVWLTIYHNYITPILSKDKYIFTVQNGYLKSYTTEEYEGNIRKRSIWDDHVFKVGLKRKI